jgi:hypothetical protein
MKEATKVFEKPATNIVTKVINKVNPIPEVKAIIKSGKDVKTVLATEIGGKGFVDGTKAIAKNTVVGSGETVVKIGMEKGIESGVKKVIKEEGIKIVEKGTTQIFEKTAILATEKAATKAAVEGTAKAGGKLASAVPVIGAAAGLAITVYDAHDAYQKTVNPNVSKLSAGLAWGTVVLDGISTVATATGVGTPIGWIATGLSLGTGFASDYFK